MVGTQHGLTPALIAWSVRSVVLGWDWREHVAALVLIPEFYLEQSWIKTQKSILWYPFDGWLGPRRLSSADRDDF